MTKYVDIPARNRWDELLQSLENAPEGKAVLIDGDAETLHHIRVVASRRHGSGVFKSKSVGGGKFAVWLKR